MNRTSVLYAAPGGRAVVATTTGDLRSALAPTSLSQPGPTPDAKPVL